MHTASILNGNTLILIALLVSGISLFFLARSASGNNLALVTSRQLYYLSSILIILASILLMGSLINNDFQNAYVYNNSSRDLPVIYRIAAFWAGTQGSFQVLYNHAPILSSLEIGRVKIEEENGNKIDFATSGGTVEVLKNKVLLLVESFESEEEIDVKRAQEAKKRAEKRLKKETDEENIDFARAEVALKRAINRLKISGHV